MAAKSLRDQTVSYFRNGWLIGLIGPVSDARTFSGLAAETRGGSCRGGPAWSGTLLQSPTPASIFSAPDAIGQPVGTAILEFPR